MRPLRLTLKNFIGIRSGLGRDELTVDLEQLTAGAELVALTGPNGMGKTTLLDNLHPYRVMPSRANGYSPGSFSYYDQAYGTEAMKELEWEHASRRYRSTIVLKMPGKTKKAECYLHVQNVDNWAPVTLPDGTTSDGKTDTYDRCVEHILGTPEMFFTSAFSAQGRRSLSSYSNGEIKGLMSELLGLDHIAELGGKASQVTKLLKARLDGMRDDIARVETRETEQAQAQEDLAAAQASLGMQMQARHTARAAVSTATKRLADVQAEANVNTDVEIRRNTLTAQLTGAQHRLTSTQRQIEADIQSERQRKATTLTAATREAERINGQIVGLQRQIDQNRAILARKGEIEAAQALVPQLAADETTLSTRLEALQNSVDEWNRLDAEHGRIDVTLAGIVREGKQLAAQCEALKNRAHLADEVPCQGTDLQGRCKLLADTMTAKADIPEADKQAEDKRKEYHSTKGMVDALAQQLSAMGSPMTDLLQAKRDLEALRFRIRHNDATAALAHSLEQAERTIALAKEQITTLEQSLAEKHAEASTAASAAEQRIQELEQRIHDARTAAQAEIATIQAELSALPPPADTSALDAAQKAVEDAEAALNEAEQAVEQLNTRIATLKERVRTLERELKDATTVKARAAVLETEIAHWTTLAKALGNDGIIALSIDDAGPTLASLANDLLLSCYGPRFTVRIDTQTQTAKGDLKESFDIVVFDAERDDEKSVRTMSGGEKIWINECLTRAIALYQAQMSGQRYECLFADESDGALDPARKQMFMRMKRKVLELGHYHQELFISHTPELWEMADARIDMTQFRV